MQKIKLGLLGATGRVGKEILYLLEQKSDFKIEGVVTSSNLSDLKQVVENSDVMVDFSQPNGTEHLLDVVSANLKPLVIGTTGLEQKHFKKMREVSLNIPILYAEHMSTGITLMNKIIKELTVALGEDVDIELYESHHRYKQDAPSGTCLMLAETVAKTRKVNLEDVACFDRHNRIGPRPKGEIGFSIQRGGNMMGSHTVTFLDEDESLEVKHQTFSRQLYAKGALRAAQWIVKQHSGLYSMADVLGL